MPERDETVGEVSAWDLPTRLFHWLLLLLIICAYATSTFAEALGDNSLLWHRINGLAILHLLVFRLLWGFFGSSTARFSSFLVWPWRTVSYALALIQGKSRPFLGHNPLGAWMVVALLGVVATQALLGLFSSDDTAIAAGPLYRLVSSDTVELFTKWHHRLFKLVLLPLIGLHILANVFYALVKREPLIKAMVTGKKPAHSYSDAAQTMMPQHLMIRAAFCLVAASALTLGTIWLLVGRIL